MSDATTSADTPSELPQVDGYRLSREVGRGGMSTVYLAEQIALGREVALKVMAPQALADETSRRRFENEVRTIARLEHPNIVRIHELGRTRDGVPYYAMPWLSRGHLGDRDFTRDEAGAVAMAEALLAALEYAHSRGVVHRDVKPENVLFDDAGRPLLADFGIALRRGFGPRVTAAGLAVGSTAYMAPEQARGEDVDGRADLYSLGVVLWEMLAGRLPYEAQDALSMALMHAQQPIPGLPAHLRHWQRFMNRALAKSADARFQNAAEMREAMLAVRPPDWLPVWERARAFAVSPSMRFAAVGVVLVVVVAAAIAMWPRRSHEDFFRTAPAAPGPAAQAAPDPVEGMLEPLPQATLDASLASARTQIARGDLVAPEGDNAVESVLTAWHAGPGDERVHAAIDEVTGALRQRIVANIKDRADTRAGELYDRAKALAEATGRADSPAYASLREAMSKALAARLKAEADDGDRARATRTVDLARALGLPADEVARMGRQVADIDRKPAVSGAVARAGRLGRPVTRAEYERFSNATGRPASLCRERASLLRVVAPRSWKTPGFEQSPGDPVVCVSFRDAEAYAQWLGTRTGHRYAIPAASAVAAGTGGSRPLSLWAEDCGRNCQQRTAAGTSWRGESGRRLLQASRGYDDVGFRLVRKR